MDCLTYSVKAYLAFTLPFIFLLYKVYQNYQSSQRYRRLKTAYGCAEPVTDTNRLPGGVDHLLSILSYRGSNILDDLLIPRFSKLGPNFVETIFGHRTFHISDPENFKAILGTNWDRFGVGPARAGAFGPFISKGILCTDGHEWKHARGLAAPTFARKELNDFESIEGHVQDLLQVLPKAVEGDQGWTAEIDLLPKFNNLTLDVASEFFLGEAAGIQLKSVYGHRNASMEKVECDEDKVIREASKDFPWAFELSANYTMQRALMQRFWYLRDGFLYRKALSISHRYINALAHKALRLRKDKLGDLHEPKHPRFMDELATSTQDPQEIHDTVLTMILAGRDTTAGLLSWIIFFLARHPAVYSRLRSEIIEQFGTHTAPDEYTYPKLRSVQYLQYIINEVLRVHGSVTLTNRTCLADTVLPTGGGSDGKQPMLIQQGEPLFLYFYALHRREDIWGADAKEFRPERWEGRKIGGWDYIPFGGGPRICIGRKYNLPT